VLTFGTGVRAGEDHGDEGRPGVPEALLRVPEGLPCVPDGSVRVRDGLLRVRDGLLRVPAKGREHLASASAAAGQQSGGQLGGRWGNRVAGRRGCALQATGKVVCWGWRETWIEDSDIELEPGPAALVPGMEHAVGLSMNARQACVREGDGRVLCWAAAVSKAGEAFLPRPLRVSGIGRAATLFPAGDGVTCEREAGAPELRCWGTVPRRVIDCFRFPSEIELNDEPPEVCVPAIRLGDTASFRAAAAPFVLPFERAIGLLQAQGTWCAHDERGRVACWACAGLGGEGQPAHPIMAPVPGLDDVVALAHGDERLCALTRGRRVLCVQAEAPSRYSFDDCRQLVGPAVPIPFLDDAVELEGASGRICARRASGRVVCWGRRDHAPLGDGRALFHGRPVRLDVAPMP
jgi:hypothetical protein